MAWRIATELHQSIKYSLLIAGHSKFGLDRCLGILKKAYKISFILSIYELFFFCEWWTPQATRVNKAQLVSTQDGRVIVPAYDWCTFLGQYFKKISPLQMFRGWTSCWLLPRIFNIPGTNVCLTEGWCCDPTCFCSSAEDQPRRIKWRTQKLLTLRNKTVLQAWNWRFSCTSSIS